MFSLEQIKPSNRSRLNPLDRHFIQSTDAISFISRLLGSGLFACVKFQCLRLPDGSWILELSRSAPIKADVRARRGNFTFPLPVQFSRTLSRRELTRNAQGCCHPHKHSAYRYLSTYLRIYRVSQIKRSFAKRPSRPTSSELIIATSAYQRPRDSAVDTQRDRLSSSSRTRKGYAKGCVV